MNCWLLFLWIRIAQQWFESTIFALLIHLNCSASSYFGSLITAQVPSQPRVVSCHWNHSCPPSDTPIIPNTELDILQLFFWKLDFESIGNRMPRFQSSFCHPNHTAQNYTSSKSNTQFLLGKIRLRKVILPTTLTVLKMEWHKENIFYRGDWRRWRVWKIWSHFHSDVLLHLKLSKIIWMSNM